MTRARPESKTSPPTSFLPSRSRIPPAVPEENARKSPQPTPAPAHLSTDRQDHDQGGLGPGEMKIRAERQFLSMNLPALLHACHICSPHTPSFPSPHP